MVFGIIIFMVGLVVSGKWVHGKLHGEMEQKGIATNPNNGDNVLW